MSGIVFTDLRKYIYHPIFEKKNLKRFSFYYMHVLCCIALKIKHTIIKIVKNNRKTRGQELYF